MTRLWPRGEPVEIWGGTEETPAGFVWKGTVHPIQYACNRWRVHARWWESSGATDTGGDGQAIWREYVKVTTGTGLLCLVYRDLLEGGWFLARVYD
jgi:hypothetical protein